MAVEGPTTRDVFETYLERLLAPPPKLGQAVMMDNLSSPKGGRVTELIVGRNCEFLYLLPYWHDLNRIEGAFVELKALLRKAQTHARKALIER